MKSELDTVILDILAQKSVKNQTALKKYLSQKGIEIDQSTLSRHLQRLGIRKVGGVYSMGETSSLEMTGIKVLPLPPNMIVVRTLPGHAQALAYRLDQVSLEGVAGTVAGDDTLFVAVLSAKYIRPICQRLANL